jgi:hypothetical protein
VKLVDTTDLKSVARVKPAYRFDSGSGHQFNKLRMYILARQSWIAELEVSVMIENIPNDELSIHAGNRPFLHKPLTIKRGSFALID